MGLRDDLSKRAAKAKIFNQGNNLQPYARYVLEVESLRYAPGGKNSKGAPADWFTPEVKVISMLPTKTPEQLAEIYKGRTIQTPNLPGSSAAMPWDTKQDWALSAMLQLGSCLTGETQEELCKGYCVGAEASPGVPAVAAPCAMFKEMQDCPHRSSTLDEMYSDDQPCKGLRFVCEVWEKPLKDSKIEFRTRQKFSQDAETTAHNAKILNPP